MRVLPVLVSRGWVRVMRNVTTQVYKYMELPEEARLKALEEMIVDPPQWREQLIVDTYSEAMAEWGVTHPAVLGWHHWNQALDFKLGGLEFTVMHDSTGVAGYSVRRRLPEGLELLSEDEENLFDGWLRKYVKALREELSRTVGAYLRGYLSSEECMTNPEHGGSSEFMAEGRLWK